MKSPRTAISSALLIAATVSITSCTEAEPEKTESASIETIQAAQYVADLPARYCDYNDWANGQMAEWLGTADDEAMVREIESSFDNLRKTVLHIWSAEYLWLQVLKDEPYDNNPVANFDGTTDELIKGWLAASRAFWAYVDNLDETALNGTRESGTDRPPLAVTDIIQHCMNHSTYHRGQLVTMGRQAGLSTPPQTDYIFYVRKD